MGADSILRRETPRKGVPGVMAQIFDNSDDKRMISGPRANGIVENFALTPFLSTGRGKIESAPSGINMRPMR